MDADGSNPKMLTSMLRIDSQTWNSDPAWSPDGLQIAFQSKMNGKFQLMTIKLQDNSAKQLTSEGENEHASWAPDARHLVFRVGSERSGSTLGSRRGVGESSAADARPFRFAPGGLVASPAAMSIPTHLSPAVNPSPESPTHEPPRTSRCDRRCIAIRWYGGRLPQGAAAGTACSRPQRG